MYDKKNWICSDVGGFLLLPGWSETSPFTMKKRWAE